MPSVRISRTVWRGLSDACGSWKTTCTLRRYAIISLPPIFVMSTPSTVIEPPHGLFRRRIARAVVDLPQPDSPTMPSVSPRFSSNETSSTALTWPTVKPNTPFLIGK